MVRYAVYMDCECGKPVLAKGKCKTCYHREYRRATYVPHPRVLTTGPCTYAAAHVRIMQRRGSAKQYECNCGRPAVQWALDHDSPRVQTGERTVYAVRGRDHIVTSSWSPDPADYDAMCMDCHLIRDGRTPRKRRASEPDDRIVQW